MKKYFSLLPLLVLFAACGGNDNSNNTSTAATDSAATAPAATNDVSSNPDYQKGLALVSKSNCFTCHKINEKLIDRDGEDPALQAALTRRHET